MWNTSQGLRVLKGNEARKFKDAAFELATAVALAIDLDERADTGVAVYDRFTGAQQAVLLADVVTGLLDPEEPVRILTAAHEACVLAVFLYQVQDDSYERQFVAEGRADAILWDRDFDMDSVVADLPPDAADHVKAELQIQAAYLDYVPDDPDDTRQLQQVFDRMCKWLDDAIILMHFPKM